MAVPFGYWLDSHSLGSSSPLSFLRKIDNEKYPTMGVNSALTAHSFYLMRKFVAIATFIGVGVLSFFHVARAYVIVTQPGGQNSDILISHYDYSPATFETYIAPNGSGGNNLTTDPQVRPISNVLYTIGGTGIIKAWECIGSPVSTLDCDNDSLKLVASTTIYFVNGILTTYVQDVASDLSRVIVTDPTHREVVATTTMVGATVYVNPDEWVEGTYLRINLVNNTLQNGIGGSALDAWQSAFGGIDLPLSSGYNQVSTSTTFTMAGQVNASWQIRQPSLGF